MKTAWDRSARQYVPIALTICIGVALSLVVFAAVRAWERRGIQLSFERASHDHMAAVRREIEDDVGVLRAIAAFFAASHEVDRHEFRTFVQPFLEPRPGIQALEWIPRVPDAQRQAYEEAARREGYPTFQITERHNQGRMIRASRREEHFPVYYLEPYKGNEIALGFDLASNPTRLEGLHKARDTGEMVATARITLVQETGKQFGVLAFLPVYRKDAPTDTVGARRDSLVGFILGVFRIGDMVDKSLTYLRTQGIDIHVYDTSAPAGKRLLHLHASGEQPGAAHPIDKAETEHRHGLYAAETFAIAGRTWLVLCTPAPGFVAPVSTWQSWGVLGVGLLFTGLVTAYLLMHLGRTAQIERLVIQRTAELSRANQALETHIAERTQAEEALQASEERLRAVVDNVVDGIITIDPGGIVESFNPAAGNIFGYEPAEVIGQNVTVLMPEPYRSEHDSSIANYMRTGKATIIGTRREVVGRRRDSSTFPMDLAVSELQLGGRRMFVGITRDITERKQAEAALRVAKDAAEQANRAKSQFLANMSHELRTPLNSIIGFANLLLKNKADNLREQDMSFLSRIQANGTHLLTLINDILDLSKIEAGRTAIEMAPVALEGLITDIIGQLEGQARNREVQLYAALPPSMALLDTDAAKLKQVLINLLGNALKFTEQGRVTVQVDVDPATCRPVCIAVSDTGIGIPQDRLATIFEAFQQADSSTTRKYGGTGLGLSISRSLCQLLGYHLEVSSEVGQGSTFRIDLTTSAEASPAHADVDRSPVVSPVLPQSARRDELHRRGPKHTDPLVLVIDDELDARIVLIHYIEDCGFRVIAANSGEQGLRMAREFRPDLITLDLMMPQMDGWEFLQHLRADPELRETPVVVVSIVASEQRGLNLGVVDLLDKPVTRAGLLEVLQRNLHVTGGKVLVVEDDADARRLIATYLAEERIENREAPNGREALEMLESFVPDLVILDLMMPVMDGMTFLEELRQDSRYLHLPVVVVTAKDLTAQEDQRLQMMASAVLKKGEALDEKLKEVLGRLLWKHAP